MRLLHQDLIKHLPRQQLLGQHRECCALRGKGWGKKHATVNYVFQHSPARLITYHWLVMNEMEKRGYNVCSDWGNISYRGSRLGRDETWDTGEIHSLVSFLYRESNSSINVYPEHNEQYLQVCIDNLKSKGVGINL